MKTQIHRSTGSPDVSHQENLTNDSVTTVLDEIGFGGCGWVIYSISKEKTSYGQFILIVEMSDRVNEPLALFRVTTDMEMIDAWNEDDDYFKDRLSSYESAEEMMGEALRFVLDTPTNREKIEQYWIEANRS